MIAVEDVHKSFGEASVLRGVTLAIHQGRTRVILGLSGSGKTVLLRQIIGLMRPDRGRILVDESDITTLDARGLQKLRRRFGMVFQQSALFDSMTVEDNVAFPLREHTRLPTAEVAKRVHEKLGLLGLSQFGHKYPAELSGGMRKRVGLARAIIMDPQYVLYDEPTTGLDPLTTDSVDQMILEAKAHLGATSVVISHDIGSALKIADDIAVIHEGRIVEDCAKAELRHSKVEFVRTFLGAWFTKQ